MAKVNKPSKPALAPRAQTGADLRAWQVLVGLLAREVAKLIGVSERTVLRAERSARPSGKVLAGFERLQERLLEGQLDIRPLLRHRNSRPQSRNQVAPLRRRPRPLRGAPSRHPTQRARRTRP